MSTTDTLDRTFAALADPTRRAILARLASGQASVTELAAPFAMSLPAVSKHLKVLERAGLVARGRRAQWRPAQRIDRFDEYLRDLQTSEPDQGEPVQPRPAKKASTTARTKGREQ